MAQVVSNHDAERAGPTKQRLIYANPYVLSLGPEETATRRLNFGQAFNPLGTNIGVLIAAATRSCRSWSPRWT
ncbi:MAG: hypothetical protein ACRDRG_11165 [Pseudonocardiaceae bacterium]